MCSMLFCSSTGDWESLGMDEGEFLAASSRSSVVNIIKSCQTDTTCQNIAEVSACASLPLSPACSWVLGALLRAAPAACLCCRSGVGGLQDSLLLRKEEEEEPGDRLTCSTVITLMGKKKMFSLF